MKIMFDSNDARCVSKTQQHYKKSCDINNIISKYRKTGILDTTTRTPFFGDFSDIGDFQTVCNRIIEANERFKSLPGDIRDKFGGDVKALLAFVNNPANEEEARKLGLIAPLPVVPADKAVEETKKNAAAAAAAAGTAQ